LLKFAEIRLFLGLYINWDVWKQKGGNMWCSS
jgi:hypothetical protein